MRLIDPEWTPARWDAALSVDSWESLYVSVRGDEPDDLALRLLAVLASQDLTRIRHDLGLLRGLDGRLVRGARMMALVSLEQYTEVYGMRDLALPQGAAPEDLFDACNASFAVGMAAGMLGQSAISCAHLYAAASYAHALRMPHREQHVVVELESARVALGDPSPVRILQAMQLLPMTSRRARRSGLALAEAYMAQGDYRAAQLAAPAESGLRAFVDVLLGERGPLPAADLDEYAAMAHAMSGHPVALPNSAGGTEAAYESLVRGHLLTRAPATAGQAATVLAARRPLTADARVFWAGLMWSAVADGAAGGAHPAVIAEELRVGVSTLARIDDVASIYRRFSPHLFVLLAYAPDIHQLFPMTLMDVPILAGNQVLYQGRSIKTPARTGAAYVVAATQGSRAPKVHHEERKRFYEDIEAMGLPCEPVNIGWVARAFALMAQGMMGAERERWMAQGRSLCDCISGRNALDACLKLFSDPASQFVG